MARFLRVLCAVFTNLDGRSDTAHFRRTLVSSNITRQRTNWFRWYLDSGWSSYESSRSVKCASPMWWEGNCSCKPRVFTTPITSAGTTAPGRNSGSRSNSSHQLTWILICSETFRHSTSLTIQWAGQQGSHECWQLSWHAPYWQTWNTEKINWSVKLTDKLIDRNIQVTWLASSRSQAQAHICLPICGAPPVSVITTLYYVAKIILHRQVWYHMLSLHYACIRSSGIILTP